MGNDDQTSRKMITKVRKAFCPVVFLRMVLLAPLTVDEKDIQAAEDDPEQQKDDRDRP